MFNRNTSHTKKFNRVYIPPKVVNNDITGSLVGVTEPTRKTTIASKKDIFSNTQITNTKTIPNTNLTASLESIEVPSTTQFSATTKSTPSFVKIINNKPIITDFENEILEFSAMKIEKQPDEIDAVNKKFIIYNMALEYGTDGVRSENIEIYVNGLLTSTLIYKIVQKEMNIEITFIEDLFDFTQLETQNIIIIGKFLEIGLELNQIDNVGLLDENNEQLII